VTELEGKQVFAVLFAAFAIETRNVSPAEVDAMISVYRRGLDDLDVDLIARAINHLTKCCERLPTIAKIRATAVDLQHGRRRPGGDAWGDVIAMIKRHGARKSPGIDFFFADVLVARAMDQMNWKELCLSTNQVADRARFIELYDEYAIGVRALAQVAPGATHPALPATTGAAQRTLGPSPLRQLIAASAHSDWSGGGPKR
jgi:hypothetical protein